MMFDYIRHIDIAAIITQIISSDVYHYYAADYDIHAAEERCWRYYAILPLLMIRHCWLNAAGY